MFEFKPLRRVCHYKFYCNLIDNNYISTILNVVLRLHFIHFNMNFTQPFIKYAWGKIYSQAWLCSDDIEIWDKKIFYWELSKANSSWWWLTWRFGELYVKWIWQWSVDQTVSKILLRAEDILYDNWLVKAYDRFKLWCTRHPSSVWERHYDIDFLVYNRMLWEMLKYTSPYWTDEYWDFDLDKAQKVCMEMICQRAQLNQWQNVLEIWFGYWTLANYMISNYGVHVTWLTVSQWQKWIAHKITDYHGTSWKTDFNLKDWKKLYRTQEFEEKYKWKFDRIVSIEMIEAVSTEDLPMFFQFLYECLNNDGILFIQAINSDRLAYSTDWFIDRYIFPDGVVPQERNVILCAEKAGFQDYSIDNSLGHPYDKALMQWWENLQRNKEEIEERCKDPFLWHYPYSHPESPFFKIFEYYLKASAGSFRSEHNRDGHFIFYKDNNHSTKIIKPTITEVQNILSIKDWGDIPNSVIA